MSNSRIIQQLNERMGIDGAVRFDAGPGGLTRAIITRGGGEAHVCQHGSHVTHFQPAGHEPVLFISERSRFERGKPIRGGVPVCFPWFAQKADDPGAPMHGFARDRNWKFREVGRAEDGSVHVTLVLKWSPHTLGLWPHRFVVTQAVSLDADGRRLAMTLNVTHVRVPDAGPLSFEAALHTYLHIGDIHQTRILGLAGAEYLDKTDDTARKRQGDDAITFAGETDRVYLNTSASCTVDDGRRRIVIEKTGSNATVVWNPWIDKAARMPDFGDEEWRRMVCIETANVAENTVTLGPGESHAMTASVRVA